MKKQILTFLEVIIFQLILTDRKKYQLNFITFCQDDEIYN